MAVSCVGSCIPANEGGRRRGVRGGGGEEHISGCLELFDSQVDSQCKLVQASRGAALAWLMKWAIRHSKQSDMQPPSSPAPLGGGRGRLHI